MASWRSIRAGRQYVNLGMLAGGKVIKDEIESIGPGEYKGNPQVIALLKKCKLACNINTTSLLVLEKAWGDDIDNWVGKKVAVKAGTAPFGKSKAPAILVTPSGK